MNYYLLGATLLLTFFVLKLLYNYVNLLVISAVIKNITKKGVEGIERKVSSINSMSGMRGNGGREGAENARKQQ